MLGRKTSRTLVLGITLLALAGCGSISDPDSTVSKALLGSANPPPPIDLDKFGPPVRCPPVNIQPGTQSLSVYEDDEVSARTLRHQATIADTATECWVQDGLLTIKIGVRGRVLAGPKNVGGEIPLPIRVAVTRDGDSVLYSEIHSIQSGLSDIETSVAWAKVIENIQVPDEGTLRILLGFDSGADDEQSERS